MNIPPHPGKIIRERCLNATGITITDAAKALNISRKTFSELINGHSGVSPEMAIRLAKAFGPSPEDWLQMQMNYDLWSARKKHDSIPISRLVNISWKSEE